jgi:hypothetical protein
MVPLKPVRRGANSHNHRRSAARDKSDGQCPNFLRMTPDCDMAIHAFLVGRTGGSESALVGMVSSRCWRKGVSIPSSAGRFAGPENVMESDLKVHLH